jgi:NAD-dependent SIR2 family protein deacetylase
MRNKAIAHGSRRRQAPVQSRRMSSQSSICQIVAVGKRRDGGTRYWCLKHKANATAKYGRRASHCLAADLKSQKGKLFELDLDQYRGAIGLWGGVLPVYDTTRLPAEIGVHVHARRSDTDEKEIDDTFSTVQIVGSGIPTGLTISDIDAIYYMVGSVFGLDMKFVACTHCEAPHLDRDWFSVHPHGRHLCSSCGKTFTDRRRAIGNPICGLREALGMNPQKAVSANRSLKISQSEFPGGIQIWGSNPALMWTGEKAEEEGIHVHAYASVGADPKPDETFSEVVIDGVSLDPVMVRLLMAQNTLPYLRGRVKSITCPRCGESVFSTGDRAFTPAIEHTCQECGAVAKATGRLRKTIGNPLPDVLALLARNAPRTPQVATLDLMSEVP